MIETIRVSPVMVKMPGTYRPGFPSTSGMWSKIIGDVVVSCDHVPVSKTESPNVMRKVPSRFNV